MKHAKPSYKHPGKERTLVELPSNVRAALDEIKRREGVSLTAQIIRAIAMTKTKGLEVEV